MSHDDKKVHLSEAVLLSQQPVAGSAYVMLQLQAPELAGSARPGQFVQIRLDSLLPLRRALSILDAEPATGRLTLLVQQHGQTGERLARVRPGEGLNILGPLGHGFQYHRRRPVPVLVGEGFHAVSLLFLARFLQRQGIEPYLWLAATPPLVQRGENPDEVERWLQRLGIAAHLALPRPTAAPEYQDIGLHLGEQVATFLHRQPEHQSLCELFVAGSMGLLRVFAQLATSQRLPAQASAFAPMACALGGCWGCAVPLRGHKHQRMARACVEGPVLPLRRLVPPPG